ncbi:MAG: LysM peptidoglycan-binding domain-containing protein, partial [Myxococcota bacterium]
PKSTQPSRSVRALVVALSLALALPAFAGADRSYTVRSGDTLIRISRRFRVSVDALRRANRLRSDRVREGQSLRIPSRRSRARRRTHHVVRRGQTLSHIARRYRVSVRSLKRANRLRGDTVRVGQELRIPGRRAENPLPRVPTRPLRPDQEQARATAAELGLGATAAARRLLVEAADARWVALARTAPETIPEHAYGVGTPIDAPAPAQAVARDAGGTATEEELALLEAAEEESAASLEENAGADGAPEPAPAAPDEALAASAAEVPEAAPGTLALPLARGHFMRGWGSGAGGYHLAIDMYEPPGSPVRAAERGVVAYASNGVSGYGRFVLVVHPNGTATGYAHLREALVVPGELLARGQVLGRLGNTGLSRGPHLHFMLLSEGTHCDPLPLFRPGLPHRSGRLVPTEPATWREERPEEVRCLPRSARPYGGRRR